MYVRVGKEIRHFEQKYIRLETRNRVLDTDISYSSLSGNAKIHYTIFCSEKPKNVSVRILQSEMYLQESIVAKQITGGLIQSS